MVDLFFNYLVSGLGSKFYCLMTCFIAEFDYAVPTPRNENIDFSFVDMGDLMIGDAIYVGGKK